MNNHCGAEILILIRCCFVAAAAAAVEDDDAFALFVLDVVVVVVVDVVVEVVVGAVGLPIPICQFGAASRISGGGKIAPANFGGNGNGSEFFAIDNVFIICSSKLIV